MKSITGIEMKSLIILRNNKVWDVWETKALHNEAVTCNIKISNKTALIGEHCRKEVMPMH